MHICSKQDHCGRDTLVRPRVALASFTLVEVVIAIGIASFALIAILGLMSYAGLMVQQSDKYSRLSVVSSQVLAQIASQEFGNPTNSPYANWCLNGQNPGPLPTTTNCYTFEGLPTNSVNGTNVYYQAVIADATLAGSTIATGVAHQRVMEPLQISILWPKNGNAAFAHTNIIITSLLNYNSL